MLNLSTKMDSENVGRRPMIFPQHCYIRLSMLTFPGVVFQDKGGPICLFDFKRGAFFEGGPS